MSINAFIRANADAELIGPFEMCVVPRVSEDIAIASADDAYGIRFFKIDELTHYAKGAGKPEMDFDDAFVLLQGIEIC